MREDDPSFLIHPLALLSHLLKDALNLQADLPSQACPCGKPPDPGGTLQRSKESVSSCSDHEQPSKAACGCRTRNL